MSDNMSKRSQIFLLAFISALLSACGGGGGGSAPTDNSQDTQRKEFEVAVTQVNIRSRTTGASYSINVEALRNEGLILSIP